MPASFIAPRSATTQVLSSRPNHNQKFHFAVIALVPAFLLKILKMRIEDSLENFALLWWETSDISARRFHMTQILANQNISSVPIAIQIIEDRDLNGGW
jgi:hypothetical protein